MFSFILSLVIDTRFLHPVQLTSTIIVSALLSDMGHAGNDTDPKFEAQ